MKSGTLLPFLLMICISNQWVDAAPGVEDNDYIRTMHLAREVEEEYTASGKIYDNKIATEYLNTIMHVLYPDYADVFRVRILISTEINAFVLPTGTVFVNLGLLMKAENEAQIAVILAHEGAHFVANHHLRTRNFARYEKIFVTADYSKSLENEADNMGFKQLVRAEYDPNEAVSIFRNIADEIEKLDLDDSSLYSTHPKLVDRIENFVELSEGKVGFTGRDTFREKTRDATLYGLKLELGKFRNEFVISLLEGNNIKSYPAQAWFFLGEAYRQRDMPDDGKKALEAYRIATKVAPEFAPTYRSLGILLMKEGSYSSALYNFREYLLLNPGDREYSYVGFYIADIAKKMETK